MAKIENKRGSKVITTCSMCGGKYTRAGLVGHMRFKHGRDWKTPMIPIEKPMGITEARKAITHFGMRLPPTPCHHVEFKFVRLESEGAPFGIWKCPSCGDLWKEVVGKVAIEKGKDDKEYLNFAMGLQRLP